VIAKAALPAPNGAGMSLATLAEYALMLAAPAPQAAAAARGSGKLSARERELVILVARGTYRRPDRRRAVHQRRTVHTHLDRIRDKTGCRRRADLTRLALQTRLT
jgi:DNA-binding CsgD family transcriptional regulator